MLEHIEREKILKNTNNPEERLALVKVIDLVVTVQKQHEKAYSDFLDPVKAGKFYDLLSKVKELNSYIFGGYSAAERKLLGFCPDYMEISDDEFPIDVLEISYNTKFSRELTHRDFLGSIMALGIDRSRVGDIVINDGVARVFVCREISGYVGANLERVGNAKVTVCEGTLADGDNDVDSGGRELRLTVASMRLDAVVSAAFHLSRSKAAGLIDGEKVFINWRMISSASKTLEQGDVITVRGLGRITLLEVCGTTKKDRLVIKVKIN